MWLLSCDGDLFGGKRLWLRPGTTHLLGRTTGKSENGERIRYIEDKTVSRKHLTITVHPVAPGSSLKIHSRSKVELKDGSKIGTLVNDEKIVGTSKTLQGTEHTLKLGHHAHLFHLKWHSVVLCPAGGLKTKDVFAAQRPGLEAADVKLLKEYVSNETTHSVGKKRNTAANLQALVQGRSVVSDAWVDALCQATASRGSDEGSALEADFDGNWPKEADYPVPPGTEPVKRPDQLYLPNPERAEVFNDFVFLFLTPSQYDNLLPAITAGGGKALLWEVEPQESRVEDLVNYVKEAAGHKDASQFKLSQLTGPGGIALIKPMQRDATMVQFIRAFETTVYQESIEQNQLLDVILTMDTSTLRPPLREEPPATSPTPVRDAAPTPAQSQPRQSQRPVTVNDSPPAPEQQTNDQQVPAEAAHSGEPSAPTVRKRQRRYITQSRFKNMNDDDDFDPSQYSKPTTQSPAPSLQQEEASQAPSAQAMDVDEPSQAPRTQQNSRKRPVQEVEEPDEEVMYRDLLPGQAALKRQKLEAAARSGDHTAVEAKKADTGKAQVKRKKAKELDVMAEVQKRREAEEEARRKDEESLRNAMEGVDISELKNLVQVEEMDVPMRAPPVRAPCESGAGDRWNPAWNGRKNFKKFRKQGSAQDGPRLPRVIVGLEQVPRKGHGIGDEYWLQPASRTSKSKSQSQSQSRLPNANDDEHTDSTTFRRRLERSRAEDAEEARAAATDRVEIASRARDEGWEAREPQASPSQTLRAESQRKRAAGSQAGGPAKRTRVERLAAAREVVDLDGDEGDELKFRRRRRG